MKTILKCEAIATEDIEQAMADLERDTDDLYSFIISLSASLDGIKSKLPLEDEAID